MKNIALPVILFLFLCSVKTSQVLQPIEEPAQILKNLDSFLAYMGENVNFYKDCILYDEASNQIPKETWLKALVTGQYLPLRLSSNGPVAYYRLYKLKPYAGNDFGQYIKGWTQIVYDYYKREGKKFPDFNFTDLKGNAYNKQTTGGKIIVLKCWFIACATCEVQRPAYNGLVDHYKDHKDILFASLADEPKNQVEAFLKIKKMDYMVIPGQKDFISNSLKINGYPVYFIINRKGIVERVLENPADVSYVLNKLI